MLRDVFYFGEKPNVHPRERYATNIDDARNKCVTSHFWIINEFCDYAEFDWDFDFDFLPDEDVWAENHNNIWPSQHQKDSGTWLCPAEHSDIRVYRQDVNPLSRKKEPSKLWKFLDTVDKTRFDFSWHPDPADPPYIYVWGSKFSPVELSPVLEYHTPGNQGKIKYMKQTVDLLPNKDCIIEHVPVDTDKWDLSWRPDPLEPPYIYVWGNKYEPAEIKPTLEYRVPGATEIKYMRDLIPVLPQTERWEIIEDIDKNSFDFSWRPDPLEPPLVYVFGNHLYQGAVMPTLRYTAPNATEIKYIDYIKPKLKSKPELFKHLEDSFGIDYSWRPDPTSPPYIYVWGNQWNKPEDKASILFVVEGATEYKYMEERATRRPCMKNWITPDNVDQDIFDYSWEPNPKEPAMIHEFATQWQKTGGPCYIVEGATGRKYEDVIKAKVLPTKDNWRIPQNIFVDSFDFSWHPDATSPPYIYHFPTQWALSGGPIYITPGADEVKYIDDKTATALPCKDNWEYDPKLIDEIEFDFSWHPYVEDQPYIYQFGTQWQKTGGPRYMTPGVHENSPVKYIDTRILKAKRLPNPKAFKILDATVKDFDYSWHSDETEDPFIYQFGNNLHPAEIMPTIEYRVVGADQIKYVHDIVATLGENKDSWEIPNNIDDSEFDYSWVPNPKDPLYIYEFATQWQKTGGPRYVVPGATEINYVDHQKVKRLPSKDNWTIVNKIDEETFDWSWHPDATSPAYIYRFPTQWALSGGPVYTVEGAKEIKYVEDQVARALPNKDNWIFDPKLIDENEFDYSWHPYVEDEPYIYQFGTQWQKTGGHQYMTPGVHDGSPIKYIDTRILKSKRLPDPNAKEWGVLNNYQIRDFDWSWHHDETEQPFIYVWGNKYEPAEIKPTLEYRVPGATDKKYLPDLIEVLPEWHRWEIIEPVDKSSFDFSWRPDPREPDLIYVFGNEQHDGNIMPTIEYRMPGAVYKKYINDLQFKAKLLPDPSKFEHLEDSYGIDYSWRPDPTSPPYIYAWGNQWNKPEDKISIQYVVEGATEYQYMDERAIRKPCYDNWITPDDVDDTQFDYSWEPNPNDPPYIYQFGTQWQKTGGPKYIVKDATDIKYIDIQKVRLLPQLNDARWEIPNELKIDDIDFFSWHPDGTEKPYIYQFSTQWALTGGPRFIMPNAKEIKFMDEPLAKTARDTSNWIIPNDIDVEDFDFSWHPYGDDQPYVYQFGTQWQKTGGPKYIVPGAKQVKYIDTRILKATKLPHTTDPCWKVSDSVNIKLFDFSWHPDETADPAIYQFGSLPGQDDGPQYIVPGNTGNVLFLQNVELDEEIIKISSNAEIPKYFIETTLEDLINKHKDEVFWALNKDLDYTKFDFDWRPDVYQSNYVNVFGQSENIKTQTFFVNTILWFKGFRELKFVEEQVTKKVDDLDIFYVDRGNIESSKRFEALRAQFPKIQKTRYLNSWADTITRCTNRATSNLIWVLNSELDYTDFDFDYYPNPWQMKMVHVFGTQWSHWGATYLVNRELFPEDTKYIKVVEHLSNLNFVKSIRAKATECVYDIVVVDHGNKETTAVVKQLEAKAPRQNVSRIKHSGDYVQNMKQIVDSLPNKKEHYIWVASSICDYSDFDFSYICDPFARDQLHVFPSNKQKFGDTFFIDVNKTRELLGSMKTLEDYEKVNYNQTLRATRLRPPVIIVEDDTHVDAVKQIEDFPYAVLVSETDKDISVADEEPMALWSAESKNIIVTSTGGTRIIVPKEAKEIKRELYEYPYIKTANRLTLSNPMDIVFLSNGETGAEENWEHLQRVTKGLSNRVVRVDGVKGRVQAYHAAVEASNTPWAFTVFAKLKVSPKFDFNWQPDRLQQPKHYIFQAKNPVNGLIYGHQAMIAYNKKLTLENYGYGLDFTLDDEHASVELLSGTAMYNTDAFSTWRTAFREVIKLLCDHTLISKERLEVWLNKADPDQPFFQESIKGALDAEEYFHEVDGDFEKLRLSYEWEWLKERYEEVSY